MVKHTTMVRHMKHGALMEQQGDLHGEILLNYSGQVHHGSNGLVRGVMGQPNEQVHNAMEHGEEVRGGVGHGAVGHGAVERGGVEHGEVGHGLEHGLQRLQQLERHG